MKLLSDNRYLVTEFDGYACYKIPVNDETFALASYLRGLHKDRLHNAGYEGYSEEIDKKYHEGGIYFYVEINNVVATTLRVNKRSDELVFPFEAGTTEHGKQYEYMCDDLAMDMNTYCLDKRYYKKATPLLFASAAEYVLSEGAKKVFGLYDVKNSATKKIYGKLGFVDSKQFPNPIAFDTFVHADTKKPVQWGILEWDDCEVAKYRELYHLKYAQKF